MNIPLLLRDLQNATEKEKILAGRFLADLFKPPVSILFHHERRDGSQDQGPITPSRIFTADLSVCLERLAGTTSASTQQQTNANMLGQSVLDVQRFPTSTFAIDSAVPVEGKSRDGHPLYKLTGKFTLHGTTRPLAMNAEVIQEKDRLRLRGGFNIKQTSFGITPFKKAFGAVGVADQMTIYGEIYVGLGTPVAQKETPETKR